MAHSNQIREFLLTADGIELRDVYLGPEGVLTGSVRLAQEAREQTAELARTREFELRRRALDRKRRELEARIAALQSELEDDVGALQAAALEEEARVEQSVAERQAMQRSRKAGHRAAAPDARRPRGGGSKTSNGSRQGARTS